MQDISQTVWTYLQHEAKSGNPFILKTDGLADQVSLHRGQVYAAIQNLRKNGLIAARSRGPRGLEILVHPGSEDPSTSEFSEGDTSEFFDAFCVNCGRKLRNDWRYCPRCGRASLRLHSDLPRLLDHEPPPTPGAIGA